MQKLYFSEIICNISVAGKMLKVKVFVMKKKSNLFGTDKIKLFDLRDFKINSYCSYIKPTSPGTKMVNQKFKKGMSTAELMFARMIKPIFIK